MASQEVALGDLSVEDVWRQFGAEVRSFVRRRVSDPYRADDIVADTLLRVHRNLGSLEDRDRLAPWLFRIARNAVIDEYRRVAANREVLDAAPGERLVDGVGDPDEADVVQSELANCLRPLLGQLSPESRRAIELTDLDGVTQASAARREGISVSGMKSRVQRARRQLADVLNRCCTLTLDARGMPMHYTARARDGQDASADDPSCGCS